MKLEAVLALIVLISAGLGWSILVAWLTSKFLDVTLGRYLNWRSKRREDRRKAEIRTRPNLDN